MKQQSKQRVILFWGGLAVVLGIPIFAAMTSPLLQWRQPAYIVAGFAGVLALCLLLIQPLAIGRYLPNIDPLRSRAIHRLIGVLLVVMIVTHVGGLWMTSPPDVIDALLFRSPTPFSVWGVIAMWCVFATALLAVLRNRFRIKHKTWQRLHTGLALVIIAGTVAHALLIEGTMETWSKAALAILAIIATLKVMMDLRVWSWRK
ncbi:MAG: ferric reductase-like transmembrane domain-containing protein [Hyphomicrobiales bacterium]